MAVPAPLMNIFGQFGQMGQGNTNTRGQLSSYQNNGPLNGLVHVLVADIDRAPAAPQQDLLNAFAAEHNVYLGWDDLKQALKELTPIQREVVLGPVLRRLVPANGRPAGFPMTFTEVNTLAHRFNINVEGYLTPDALKLTRNTLKATLVERFTADDKAAAFILEEPAERVRLRVAALNAAQQASLRGKIRTRPLTVSQEMDITRRAELELKRREALPLTDPLSSNANQIPVAGAIAAPIATLKLWQSADNQYQFDTLNPAEHNGHYASHSFASYERQSTDVKAVVEKAVTDRQAGQPVKLKKAFQQFELEQSKKPGAFADKMQNQMNTMLSSMTGMLGFGDQNGIAGFIGKIFSNIFGGLFQLFGPLSSMKDMFSKMGKTAGSSLDDDEEMKELKERDPVLAAETKEFAGLVEKLEESGADGAEEAHRLNAAWRTTPNTPAVWRDVAVTMIRHGLNDEVDNWMSAKTKKTLDHLIREERRIIATGRAATPQLLGQLEETQRAFAILEDPRINPRCKAEAFNLRATMFERVMGIAIGVTTAESADKQEQKEHVQLNQKVAGLTVTEQAAQAAHSPIAGDLAARLLAAQQALVAHVAPVAATAAALAGAKTNAANAVLPPILIMARAKNPPAHGAVPVGLPAELRRLGLVI
jgi:hypothetical protein